VNAHNVISVTHLGGAGILHATTSTVPWAILHARTFEHDVLECGECRGRLRDIAVIVDPAVASNIPASISRRDGPRWFGGSWSAVCIVGHWAVERSFSGDNGVDGWIRGIAMWWGFGELMGLRFWVDASSMACDRNRDARCG